MNLSMGDIIIQREDISSVLQNAVVTLFSTFVTKTFYVERDRDNQGWKQALFYELIFD